MVDSIVYGKGGVNIGSPVYGLGGLASGSPIYTTELEAEIPDTAWSPVTFDGTNDTMLHGGSLTGLVNGITGTFAFRVAPAANGTVQDICTVGNGRGIIQRNSANRYQLTLANAADVDIVIFLATTTHVIADGARTILVSWNLDTVPVCNFYIDGVSQGTAATLTADTVGYTNGTPNWGAFGTPAYPPGIFNGDAIFLYFDDSYIDLSVSANRDKFLQANIGATGDGITGSDPLVYITGDASDWNDVGGINFGTGGPFYMSGEVVDV